MTIQQIRYVLAVAASGSMNKAAERLYITQPSLTNAIRDLETELGIQLFFRSNKGVVQTTEGADFIARARQLYHQYELLLEQYREPEKKRQHFGVSTQHYAFAVGAFADTVRAFGAESYDFELRESRTFDVIRDVAGQRSEIGVLYISRDNGKVIRRMLEGHELCFEELIVCRPHVFLWKGHPLAERTSLRRADLADYPCLTFAQGDDSSDFLAEEIVRDIEAQHVIRTTDRATMLNLMPELNAYTICSGILGEARNRADYKTIVLEEEPGEEPDRMHIGYIKGARRVLSETGAAYLQNLRRRLEEEGPGPAFAAGGTLPGL